MNGQIHINEMIAEIRSDDMIGYTFFLKFVKKDGGFKVIAKARYGSKKQKSKTTPKRAYSKTTHVENATLPIVDTELDQYMTPFISHIIQYNNLKVVH